MAVKPVNTFTTRSRPVEMALYGVAPAMLCLKDIKALDIGSECDSREH